MLNRSCERCRIKKLRCPGGKSCGICLGANATCIYKQRKKKVMRKKRLAQNGVVPGLNDLLSNNLSRSNSDSTSDEIHHQPSDSTPSSSSHPSSLISSNTSISATPHSHTFGPLTDFNQSKSLNPGK
jgi:uncharacterized Zn finger protein (UPF0148 family)